MPDADRPKRPAADAEAGEPSLEELRAQIEALKADLVALAEAARAAAAQSAREVYGGARRAGRRAGRRAAAAAERGYEAAGERLDEALTDAESLARARPAAALGLAAAAGFLLAMLLTRR